MKLTSKQRALYESGYMEGFAAAQRQFQTAYQDIRFKYLKLLSKKGKKRGVS